MSECCTGEYSHPGCGACGSQLEINGVEQAAIGVPLAARYLDRYDQEQRFTVGYHVTAIRGLKRWSA